MQMNVASNSAQPSPQEFPQAFSPTIAMSPSLDRQISQELQVGSKMQSFELSWSIHSEVFREKGRDQTIMGVAKARYVFDAHCSCSFEIV